MRRLGMLGVAIMLVLSGCRDSRTSILIVDPDGKPGETPAVLARIEVQPPTASRPVGSTLQLQAVCYNTAGQAVQCPANLWWFSDDPSKIAVNSQTGLITFVGQGTARVCVQRSQTVTQPQGCGTYTTSPQPTASLSATPQQIILGQSSTLTWATAGADVCVASASPADSNWSGNKPLQGSQQVTPTATTIYSLTCSGPGGTVTASVTVAVLPPTPTVVLVTVSPKTLSLYPTTCPSAGQTTGQLNATVQVTGGASQAVNWTSSNTAVASVSSTGLVTAHSAGSTIITVRSTVDQSKFDTVVVTVLSCPAQPGIISVTVSPKTLSLYPTTCPSAGQTTGQLNATVQVTGGASQAVNWTSSNTAVASVSSTGLVTAHGAGTATITVRSTVDQSKYDTVVVTVLSCPAQPIVTSVVVAPKTLTCTVGGQATFGASVTASGGASTAVTWTVSDPSVAAIASTANNQVVLNCLKVGTVTVRATSVADPTKWDTGTLTVQALAPGVKTIELVLPKTTIAVNETMTAQAVCRIDGQVASCNPWFFSSDPSKVSIDPRTGVIRGLASGTVEICVQWSQTETSPVACRQVTVSAPASTITGVTISVSPTGTIATCPSTVTFNVSVQGTGSYNQGATLTASSGTLTSTGTNQWSWQATQSGTFTFTATATGDPTKTQTITVTVNCPAPPPPSIVLFSASPQSITAGQSSTLSWDAKNVTSCSATGGWSGSKPVTGTQQVSPTQTTTYTLTCTGPAGSVSANVTVTVTQATVTSVTVAPKTATCNVGSQASFGASVLVQGNLSTDVLWSVSDPSKASIVSTVNNQLVLNCLGAGTVTVTARSAADQTKFDTGTLTISAPVSNIKTIELTASSFTLAVGGTRQTQAVCKIDGQVVSCNPWWYSAEPSRISVDPRTGLLTALASGMVQICVQWSQTETSPVACRSFTAQ
jgi:uncharacterized protein YjdB